MAHGRSTQAFIAAFRAEGIGHSTEPTYRPYDHHCPQLPQPGLNSYKASCEARRKYGLRDNPACRKYPDCPDINEQMAKAKNGGHNRQARVKGFLKRNRKTPEQMQAEYRDMYDRWKSGEDFESIAETNDRSVDSVRTIVCRIERERHMARNDDLTRQIAKRIRSGETIKSIRDDMRTTETIIMFHKKRALQLGLIKLTPSGKVSMAKEAIE